MPDTTQPGYVNRNGQVVVRNTGLPVPIMYRRCTSLAARPVAISTELTVRISICDYAQTARVVLQGFRMGGVDNVVPCQKPRTTVAQVTVWLDRGERKRVADFVQARFMDRYFQPAESLDDREDSGFAIMALCWLVVESLSVFTVVGRRATRKAKEHFRQVFDREPTFSVFRGYSKEFYVNVRCGIHHQGETTGGWRIWKYGATFVPA